MTRIKFTMPWRLDKNLGLAYNEEFKGAGVRMDDWVALCDIDTCFLTPDAPRHIYEYVAANQDAGILTAFTNRVGCAEQRIKPEMDRNADIAFHIRRAMGMEARPKSTTDLVDPISGFLMIIKKSTWRHHKFPEGTGSLGVDTEYSKRILAAGLRIVRMNTIYVWHSYRLIQGQSNTTHLQ